MRHGIPLLADAAPALGATLGGKPIGAWADVSCFSLGRGKAVSAGEGGVAVCHDPGIFERMMLVSQHPLRALRELEDLDLRRSATESCLNYRMAPLSAALGLAQLRNFHEALRRRRHSVRVFSEGLAAIGGFEAPPDPEGIEPTYHNVVVRYTASDRGGRPRAEVIDALRALGVPATAGPIRAPLHRRPPFSPRPTGWYPKAFRPGKRHPSWSEGACPNAERRCADQDIVIESESRWQSVPLQRIAELIRAFDRVASGT